MGLAAVLVTAMVAPGVLHSASAPLSTSGTVHFAGREQDGVDSGARLPGARTRSFLRRHALRMLVYAPSFDRQTSWYRGGWLYQDAYAIYPRSRVGARHPGWILRDRSGRRAYIPWGCRNGTCPQYAADITDPAFRRFFIARARAALRGGHYRGLFVDDVNLLENVSDGRGHPVLPFDAAHHVLSPADWRTAMAGFMAEIRAALPRVEIVHNVIWYAEGADPAARQETAAADYIYLERGANDAGLTGGGQFAFSSLLDLVDQLHAQGRHVILDGSATATPGLTYNLATYFLISDGRDLVSSPDQGPRHWWRGYDVDLGAAVSARYAWRGLLRRDFVGGMVLVDPPGGPSPALALSRSLRTAAGGVLGRLSLHPRTAVILLGRASVRPG